jgi:hypothetical protein
MEPEPMIAWEPSKWILIRKKLELWPSAQIYWSDKDFHMLVRMRIKPHESNPMASAAL